MCRLRNRRVWSVPLKAGGKELQNWRREKRKCYKRWSAWNSLPSSTLATCPFSLWDSAWLLQSDRPERIRHTRDTFLSIPHSMHEKCNCSYVCNSLISCFLFYYKVGSMKEPLYHCWCITVSGFLQELNTLVTGMDTSINWYRIGLGLF